MARLHVNENFPLPVVTELLRLGQEVLTIVETGQAGQALADEQVLACLRDSTYPGGRYRLQARKGRRFILMKQIKIVIEQHPDGYVAYPLGLKGVVVSQGNSYDEVLSQVTSAIQFHIETFGPDVIDDLRRSSTA
jgi:predicted RNase H-like HicB family nuclease